MTKLQTAIKGLRERPGYTLMRGLGRFRTVRSAVAGVRGALHASALKASVEACRSRMKGSMFQGVDPERFAAELERDGMAFGLMLPAGVVQEIRDWAEANRCYADRNPAHGFRLTERVAAERTLGKPILVAQYFNTGTECTAIRRLTEDPFLGWVASRFIGSRPKLVGTNLWWTFPVKASAEDRDRHAHLFHRDVDDFRFFKLFFYITDVGPGDGAHVCVIASHDRPPMTKRGDRWNIRRYTDQEIAAQYPAERIKEICGPAGTGFAENTLCIHKGLTPTRSPRLLLQVQYALFDYGEMHDRRAQSEFQGIA